MLFTNCQKIIRLQCLFCFLQWYAIMLDYVGEYEGTKERISKAYHIKEHFLVIIFHYFCNVTDVHVTTFPQALNRCFSLSSEYISTA